MSGSASECPFCTLFNFSLSLPMFLLLLPSVLCFFPLSQWSLCSLRRKYICSTPLLSKFRAHIHTKMNELIKIFGYNKNGTTISSRKFRRVYFFSVLFSLSSPKMFIVNVCVFLDALREYRIGLEKRQLYIRGQRSWTKQRQWRSNVCWMFAFSCHFGLTLRIRAIVWGMPANFQSDNIFYIIYFFEKYAPEWKKAKYGGKKRLLICQTTYIRIIYNVSKHKRLTNAFKLALRKLIETLGFFAWELYIWERSHHFSMQLILFAFAQHKTRNV